MKKDIPHIMKYMGCKREMLEDINRAVEQMNLKTTSFCDLFAGTAIVSYAISDCFDIVSNDIQMYSKIMAQTYFANYSSIKNANEFVQNILQESKSIVGIVKNLYPKYVYDYRDEMSFEEMEFLENEQLKLIETDFVCGFSLFKKCYSGTYWSYEQCMWIDAIRAVAERYNQTPIFYAILSSLMYAMSYCAQSTGHFAQYRSLTRNNYRSVLMYRMKSIPMLFQKKMIELITTLNKPIHHQLRTTTLDCIDCIATLKPGTLIYADPPYSAVHYSRFYHVMETLVRYDNPKVEYKGRYREERYQSPFDQKSNVAKAFLRMFEAIRSQKCHLLLSYSDNALMTQEELINLANRCMGDSYSLTINSRNYQHMKMGRNDEAHLDVHELLMSFKYQKK